MKSKLSAAFSAFGTDPQAPKSLQYETFIIGTAEPFLLTIRSQLPKDNVMLGTSFLF